MGYETKQRILQRLKNTENHIFEMFNILDIREMQIKIILRERPRLTRTKEKKAHFSLLVGIQTCTATVEMSVASLQEAENQCTSISSYRKLGNKPKGLWTILQWYLLIHVHGCSSHNSQKLKKRDVSKDKNINKKQIFPLHKLLLFFFTYAISSLRTLRNEADDIAKINIKMIAAEE